MIRYVDEHIIANELIELRPSSPIPCCFRVTGIHVSHCQAKSTRFLRALGRARNRSDQVSTVTQLCLSACGSCSPQNRTSICCLRLRRVRTEDRVCVLCQSRNKPMGASGVASVAQPVICGTWQPAHRMILMSFHSRESFTQRQCR